MQFQCMAEDNQANGPYLVHGHPSWRPLDHLGVWEQQSPCQPAKIVPEWHFPWVHASLCSILNKLGETLAELFWGAHLLCCAHERNSCVRHKRPEAIHHQRTPLIQHKLQLDPPVS